MFVFGAPSLHRKFQFQDFWICGVPWHGGVRNIILLHTHTHILSQHFTNIFSLHTTHYSHATLCCHEPKRSTFVEFCSSVPTCVVVSSMFFTMRNQEFLHGISLLLQAKSD
jgi:hypothetical protein